MNEPMPCQWCDDEHFGEPALLNIHGMLASEGEPACWGHGYEDDWWPCIKKAAEEHALVGELRKGLIYQAIEDAKAATAEKQPG